MNVFLLSEELLILMRKTVFIFSKLHEKLQEAEIKYRHCSYSTFLPAAWVCVFIYLCSDSKEDLGGSQEVPCHTSAQGRVSVEVRPGCSGLYPVGFPRMDCAQHLGATCSTAALPSPFPFPSSLNSSISTYAHHLLSCCLAQLWRAQLHLLSDLLTEVGVSGFEVLPKPFLLQVEAAPSIRLPLQGGCPSPLASWWLSARLTLFWQCLSLDIGQVAKLCAVLVMSSHGCQMKGDNHFFLAVLTFSQLMVLLVLTAATAAAGTPG